MSVLRAHRPAYRRRDLGAREVAIDGGLTPCFAAARAITRALGRSRTGTVRALPEDMRRWSSPWIVSAMAACLVLPGLGRAQDRVLLAEALPVLEGSELGLIEVGDAPAPGSARTLRRAEILAALRQAGRSAEGLAIPRSVRIERSARRLGADELAALLRPAVEEALAPCVIGALRAPADVVIAPGPTSVHSDARPPARGGSVAAGVVIEAGGQERRVFVRAEVSCPPPVVAPGQRVRVVAVSRNVRATAFAEARQAGRVGDVIRIARAESGVTMRARIIDAGTVEVVR